MHTVCRFTEHSVVLFIGLIVPT